MGLVFQSVRVSNPLASRRSETIDFLVDTGAIWSYVPRTLLRRLGIRPKFRETFELADGRKVRRLVGEATFGIDGRSGASPVVFGLARDQPLLGVVTLESLGLAVDPVRQRLRPARLLLMRAA